MTWGEKKFPAVISADRKNGNYTVAPDLTVKEAADLRVGEKLMVEEKLLKPLPAEEGEKWFPISDNLGIGNIVRHAPTGKLLGHIMGAKPGMSGMTVRVSRGGQVLAQGS